MLRADRINMWPVHDPVVSVVMQASVANVEHVMIGGVWKKVDGALVYPQLEAKKPQLAASGHRILRELGLAH